MANETLIAYENAEKQRNLDIVDALQNTITAIDQTITQTNTNIATYEAQKTDVLRQISDINANNVFIDEIITILSA